MMKRAHLQGVKFGLRLLEEYLPGMTPARFDLMYAIRTAGWQAAAFVRDDGRNGWWMRQDELRRRLGVCASAVSEMIARLRKLGWVTNDRRALDDRRTRIVELTTAGRDWIDLAMILVLDGHSHRGPFEEICGRWEPSAWPVEVVGDFLERVTSVARAFDDGSRLAFPIGDDECDLEESGEIVPEVEDPLGTRFYGLGENGLELLN